jgi:hypothetical protein
MSVNLATSACTATTPFPIFRAFFLQALGCRQADAAVSTGYHGYFSFESLHVVHLLSVEFSGLISLGASVKMFRGIRTV